MKIYSIWILMITTYVAIVRAAIEAPPDYIGYQYDRPQKAFELPTPQQQNVTQQISPPGELHSVHYELDLTQQSQSTNDLPFYAPKHTRNQKKEEKMRDCSSNRYHYKANGRRTAAKNQLRPKSRRLSPYTEVVLHDDDASYFEPTAERLAELEAFVRLNSN